MEFKFHCFGQGITFILSLLRPTIGQYTPLGIYVENQFARLA